MSNAAAQKTALKEEAAPKTVAVASAIKETPKGMIELDYVRFHTDIHFPETGTIGQVLPSQHRAFDTLEMYWGPEAVLLNVAKEGRKYTILVPHANVVAVRLKNK